MNFNKLAIILILVCLFLSSHQAWAKGTLAGTQIKNQASATYEDEDGNTLTATSNEVITTVLPIYQFTVTPDGTVATPGQSQISTIGNTVYFPYKLLNESNTTETFKMLAPIVDGSSTFTPQNLKIYRDDNGNGIVDPGEAEIPINGTFGPIGVDQIISFIVSYQVPVTATAGQIAILTPVVETTSATPAQQDNNNYCKTTVVSDAVVTANITAAPTVASAGTKIDYTISGSNTGTVPAQSQTAISVDGTPKDGILVWNQLPTNLTFDSIVTSGGATGSVVVYSMDGTAWTTVKPANPTYIGLFMPDANPSNGVSEPVLAQGQSYSLEYKVTVNAGTPAGVITDNAAVKYSNASGTPLQVTTNNVDVTILAAGSVAVGHQNNAQDDTLAVANGNLILQAAAGSTVIFNNSVRNNGNASDIFNLTYNSSDLPAGSVVQFLYADGTPMSDSNNDNIPDLGSLDAGISRNFKVKVILPSTATNVGFPHDLIITATSVNTPTAKDTTTDRIEAIVAPSVNLGNYDGVNGTVNDNLVNMVGQPGTTVYFPLDLINTGAATDTFVLTTPTLPPGYTVVYYIDLNGDGKLDPNEMVPITSLTLGPGMEGNIIAVVQIPANATPGTNNIEFKATSTQNPTVSNSIVDSITIPTTASATFAPDRTGTGISGGTVTYQHILTNTGNASDTFALTYTSPSGWTYVFYDSNGNPITNITLAPGESANIAVKAFIPTGAAPNSRDSAILKATSGNNPAVAPSVVDTTIVIPGVMQLSKRVSNVTQGTPPAISNTGKPGEVLRYHIDYRNNSTGNLKNLKVIDVVPANTTFVGYDATITGPAGSAIIVEFSADSATYVTNPASVAGGINAVKFIRWTLGATTLIPAGFDSMASGKTLTFDVKIK